MTGGMTQRRLKTPPLNPTPPAETQHQRLGRIVEQLSNLPMVDPQVEPLLAQLEQVLAEAQNDPPQGVSDGSVSGVVFNFAQQHLQAWRTLLRTRTLVARTTWGPR